MNIFLVRPHPPHAILSKSCPIPEAYKYNWQPMALKYIAYHLLKAFGDTIEIKLWHLMNAEDDLKLEEALKAQKPEIVIFSEIDILVNEVNKLACLVKKLLPQSWTIVGGKHTSLLREGDHFPYQAIDFAIRGEGIHSLKQIITACIEGNTPQDCPAVLQVDVRNIVTRHLSYDHRTDIAEMDGIWMHSFPVENHSYQEYLENHQIHPALIPGKIRTASMFTGSGCPYQCVFCQSPVEHGPESQVVKSRLPEKVAEEIVWLIENHEVNNIFSLEPNLNLANWLKTYEYLEQFGISYLPVSGFIRAADILEAHHKGILAKLVEKGMRVLSVGLDIPFDSEKDIYKKAFSPQTLLECLSVCENLGILIMATFIGDPNYTDQELKKQLQYLQEVPICAVDIRLSIALRNTEYYRQMSPWLIYRPEENRTYFNRQNYRYQTIQIPGKITPTQTYKAVRSFHQHFLTGDKHLDYVLRFVQRYPETIPFFRSQYTTVIKNHVKKPLKMYQLAELMELSEVTK